MHNSFHVNDIDFIFPLLNAMHLLCNAVENTNVGINDH
jgi:hypothetical protein